MLVKERVEYSQLGDYMKLVHHVIMCLDDHFRMCWKGVVRKGKPDYTSFKCTNLRYGRAWRKYLYGLH